MATIEKKPGTIHLLTIRKEHWDFMEAHIIASSKAGEKIEEVCGLLAGKDGISQAVYSITNSLHSPTRFLMDALEEVTTFSQMEQMHWDLLAIYHSHPQGPPYPSETDIAMAAFPEAVNIIWSPQAGVWDCRGFLIQENTIQEVKLQILP